MVQVSDSARSREPLGETPIDCFLRDAGGIAFAVVAKCRIEELNVIRNRIPQKFKDASDGDVVQPEAAVRPQFLQECGRD